MQALLSFVHLPSLLLALEETVCTQRFPDSRSKAQALHITSQILAGKELREADEGNRMQCVKIIVAGLLHSAGRDDRVYRAAVAAAGACGKVVPLLAGSMEALGRKKAGASPGGEKEAEDDGARFRRDQFSAIAQHFAVNVAARFSGEKPSSSTKSKKVKRTHFPCCLPVEVWPLCGILIGISWVSSPHRLARRLRTTTYSSLRRRRRLRDSGC